MPMPDLTHASGGKRTASAAFPSPRTAAALKRDRKEARKESRGGSVGFGTVEIRECQVGVSGSSVPTDGGPPLGMVGPVKRIRMRRLDSFERERSTGFRSSPKAGCDSEAPKPLRRGIKAFCREGRLSAEERIEKIVAGNKEVEESGGGASGTGGNKQSARREDLELAVRECQMVIRRRLETNLSPMDQHGAALYSAAALDVGISELFA